MSSAFDGAAFINKEHPADSALINDNVNPSDLSSSYAKGTNKRASRKPFKAAPAPYAPSKIHSRLQEQRSKLVEEIETPHEEFADEIDEHRDTVKFELAELDEAWDGYAARSKQDFMRSIQLYIDAELPKKLYSPETIGPHEIKWMRSQLQARIGFEFDYAMSQFKHDFMDRKRETDQILTDSVFRMARICKEPFREVKNAAVKLVKTASRIPK